MILTQKKKRKNLQYLIGMSETFIDDSTKSQIQLVEEKLKKIFQDHIGKEKAIHPSQIFIYVFGKNPYDVDVYKRAYLWDFLKKVLRKMRSENSLFVVTQGNVFFVLKSESELKVYKDRTDAHIKSLGNMKKNAEDWVREKKWLEFSKQNFEEKK